MRVVVDGVEYISGATFNMEFCATESTAAKWRCEGMPFVYGSDLGIPKRMAIYLYPVEKCHAWFRREE